jgi:hypothetical protein
MLGLSQAVPVSSLQERSDRYGRRCPERVLLPAAPVQGDGKCVQQQLHLRYSVCTLTARLQHWNIQYSLSVTIMLC